MTAGTLFDKTRTPLTSWFAAVWYVTSQKHGVSALGLKRVLGLGSYQTAWSMLHRLRRAMVRPDRDALSGDVEVDELFLAGPVRLTPSWRARYPSLSHRALNDLTSSVAVAVEVLEPKGLGRVHLRRIVDASEQSLLPFVLDAVERGSTVHTDGSAAYRSLSGCGYKHEQHVHLGSSKLPHVTMLPSDNQDDRRATIKMRMASGGAIPRRGPRLVIAANVSCCAGADADNRCFFQQRGNPLPGRHITDHQMRLYMTFRRDDSVPVAAAKASISSASGYRIERDPRLPSQKQTPRGRRRPDPLAGIFDEHLIPMLVAAQPAACAAAVG